MTILGGYPFIDPDDIPSLSDVEDRPPREACPSCGSQLDAEFPYECFGCGMTPREWELERKGLGGR